MAKTWENCKSLPSKRCYSAVLTYTGPIPMLRNETKTVLFLIGGCDQVGIPVDTLYMYFPEKDFWFPLKSMSCKRASPICHILNNNYIVALGGVGNDPPQQPVKNVEIYDISKNVWYQMPGMTHGLMGMASLKKNNNILIFGGMSIDTNPIDDVKMVALEETSNSNTSTGPTPDHLKLIWKPLPRMPSARYGATALDFDDRVAVVGGRVGKTPVNKFEVYEKNSATWHRYPNFPVLRVFKGEIW